MAKVKQISKEDIETAAALRVPGFRNSDKDITCIARTVQCFDNQGFRNFRILTLHITDGVVEKIDYSDAYANFETISRLELANEMSVLNLNNNWVDGKALSK